MGVTDQLNYLFFQNPVSSSVIDLTKQVNAVSFRSSSSSVPIAKIPPALENLPVGRLVLMDNPFVRLAGISGVAAVILGAYGAHSVYAKSAHDDQKRIYQTAHTYHFMHTLALLGVPLCKSPIPAGTFFIIGMFLFCGTCYYDALTGNPDFRKLTPIGGTCLIFGWLCLML